MTINNFSDDLHPDLLAANLLAYEPSGLKVMSKPVKERESEDYGAYIFEMNNRSIIFRVAKITPKKIGQFVTLWKRIGSGPIMPFDLSDPVDLFVISVHNGTSLGQFVFPKVALCNHGIVSRDGKGGKRAMRVYPPWDKPQSRQAQASQRWQLSYFFEIPIVDREQVRKLFSY